MKGLRSIAMLSMMFAASAVSHAQIEALRGDDYGTQPGRERRGKGQRNRRGRGAVARPKKRPNRLTISKRVRRKHRRRAA